MANTTYPEAPPVIAGDTISASRFLQNPRLVARRLQQLGDLRYIGNLLLPGRQASVGGAVAYETLGEGIFAFSDGLRLGCRQECDDLAARRGHTA